MWFKFVFGTLIMSKVKEKFEQSGYAIEILEVRPFYLRELFCEAVKEIDENQLLGNRNFGAVSDIVDILKKYQIPSSAKFSDLRGFPYIPLWPAVREYCHKDMNSISELREGIQEVTSDLSCLVEPPPPGQETKFDYSSTTPLVLIFFAEMYEKHTNQLKKFCMVASKSFFNAMDDGYSRRYSSRQ